MTQDNQEREESLFSEFERLGNNLRDAFTTAWESEERKEVQEEIRRGLSEVNRALHSRSGRRSRISLQGCGKGR